jgi:hypothetical protein
MGWPQRARQRCPKLPKKEGSCKEIESVGSGRNGLSQSTIRVRHDAEVEIRWRGTIVAARSLTMTRERPTGPPVLTSSGQPFRGFPCRLSGRKSPC